MEQGKQKRKNKKEAMFADDDDDCWREAQVMNLYPSRLFIHVVYINTDVHFWPSLEFQQRIIFPLPFYITHLYHRKTIHLLFYYSPFLSVLFYFLLLFFSHNHFVYSDIYNA